MYHTITKESSVENLCSNAETGLSQVEANVRLKQYGANAIPETKPKPWYVKLFAHFNDFLMLVLLAAAIFSFAIGEEKDAVVILIIIIANACMGYIQELKADNAIAVLKRLSGSNAKVLREGGLEIIPAEMLVPGDIIIIENGDKIPADARLIESVYLKVSESSLTGESRPSEKSAEFIGTENLPTADRLNIIYKDTLVVFGRGRAIVTTTGIHTEMGKIFSLLQKENVATSPLSKELKVLGKGLTIFAGITAVFVFSFLVFSTGVFKEAFLTAISMAIAVVPEGIPAVVTTVLAISVARMAKNNAIVRKMESVETLGAATCILTDKTGTLTKNEMTVTDIHMTERYINVSNEKFTENNSVVNTTSNKELQWLLTASVLCNDSQFSSEGVLIGDPTETCLLRAANDAGINILKIREDYPRIDEIPFSSETKLMSVAVQGPDGMIHIITKGATESVSAHVLGDDSSAQKIAGTLAENGIRALMFASKTLSKSAFLKETEGAFLADQTFLGIIGSKDPLRSEAKDAIEQATSAGIRTIMITGDHRLIAKSIGTEIGIVSKPEDVIDGSELANFSDEQFRSIVRTASAFSRVSPEQKLKIVKAAMENGETVVVTGDGVNDAPAIKIADIGVAMGITGTDVAKEVADIVLQDDNYSTIVKAIKQGRGIFQNFIKFLKYQISCNLSGVLIVLPVTFVTGVTPLLPVHILLLNLISETAPSIALGLEKPDRDIMKMKPRKKNSRLLSKARWMRIVFESIILGISGVSVFLIARATAPEAATSAVLVTAFLSRLWHALNSRSETLSVFSSKLEHNSSLYYAIIATLAILTLSVYTKIGNTITKTVPLSSELLLICVSISLLPLIVIEVYKAWKAR